MKWYLLRQRRHDGPFEQSDVEAALKAGRISRGDFLLSESDFDAGRLNYRKVSEIFAAIPVVPKVEEKPVPSAEELLNQLGTLDTADILGAQKRVLEDQGRGREEARADSPQVLYVERAEPRRNFFRFNRIPTFAIVALSSVLVVGVSLGFLAVRKPKIIQAGTEQSTQAVPDRKDSAGPNRRPAQSNSRDDGGRIMPTDSYDRPDVSDRPDPRDRHDHDLENDRGEEDFDSGDRIEKDAGGEDLDRIKRKRSKGLRRMDRRNRETEEGIDVDSREKDRRPGAADEGYLDDGQGDNEDQDGNVSDEGNDEGDPENPEFVD